ncbi:hypothetical protein T484DRAFT_1815772, partial [Baffinella frigidus]
VQEWAAWVRVEEAEQAARRETRGLEQACALRRKRERDGATAWGHAGQRGVAAKRQEGARVAVEEEMTRERERMEREGRAACVAAQESALTRRRVWEGAWGEDGGRNVAAERRELRRRGRQEREEEEKGRAVRVTEQQCAVQRRLVGEGTSGKEGWGRVSAERQEAWRRGQQEEEEEEEAGRAARVAEQESAVQRRRVGEGALGGVGGMRAAAERREARRRVQEKEEEEERGRVSRAAEQACALLRRSERDGATAWGDAGQRGIAAERQECARVAVEEEEWREIERMEREEGERREACVAAQEGALTRRRVLEGAWGGEGWRRVAAARCELRRRGKHAEEEKEERGRAACTAAQKSALTRRRVWEGALRKEGWMKVEAELRETKRSGKEEEEEESAGCARAWLRS